MLYLKWLLCPEKRDLVKLKIGKRHKRWEIAEFLRYQPTNRSVLFSFLYEKEHPLGSLRPDDLYK